MIDKIIRICTRYMAVGVILAGIFGIFFPSVMKPLSPYIPIMLGIIMFGMGMSLTPGDFRNVFKQPKNVALGSLLQFVIMPALAAILIQIFALPPAIAIGVVLVGCCPGGTASNVISYIAHADVALSVSMTMVNTILAPFVTPFLIWLIAGAWVDISFTAMMISIIKMVLLPLLAGVGFNYFFPRQVAKVTKVMPMLSALVIIFTVGCVVSLSGRTILDNGLIILAVVILHNLGGMALAPFVTPFLIWLIAGAWVDISFTAMMISIIKMVLLPLLAGVGFNYFFPRQVAKVTKVMPMLSALVIIFTVGCVVSLSGRTILDNGLIILAVVILHNLGGMALGFFCARKFGMTKAQIRAMAIEVGMQNSGLASTLALMYFTAAGGIAGAIFSVWHNVSGSLFASWCVGRDEEEMETKTAVQMQVK